MVSYCLLIGRWEVVPGTIPVRFVKYSSSHIKSWHRMHSSTTDSSKTFSRSRKIMAERDLYPLLRAVIGAAMYIIVARASIVSTPLLKPRELGLIGWADYLTLVSTNRSMTFENAGSSKMGRCVLSFFGIGIILAIFI